MTRNTEGRAADQYGDRISRDLAAEMRKGRPAGSSASARTVPSEEDPRVLPIEDLRLTVLLHNCLNRAGIHIVSDLIIRSERDLLGLPGFGAGDLRDLKQKLAGLGLELKRSGYSGSFAADRRGAGVAPSAPPRGAGVAPPRPPRHRGALSLGALNTAGILLPARERERWLEEWANELVTLKTRRARARVACSLLFGGIPRLAVTLRRAARHPRSAWPGS